MYQQAQAFMEALLVGDVDDKSTLEALVAQARELSPGALDIAAAITGVAGGDGSRFIAAVEQITPAHLNRLRQNFRNMSV